MKKKTVIAIIGGGGTGKTQTIKKTIQVIQNRFPKSHVEILIYGVDIKVVITIKNIIIGIESYGDPLIERLSESLSDFAKKHCDIIICATRTKGDAVTAIDNMHNKNNYDIIWAANYVSYEKSQPDLNQLSAEHIVDLIDKLLTNQI